MTEYTILSIREAEDWGAVYHRHVMGLIDLLYEKYLEAMFAMWNPEWGEPYFSEEYVAPDLTHLRMYPGEERIYWYGLPRIGLCSYGLDGKGPRRVRVTMDDVIKDVQYGPWPPEQ